MRFWIPLVILSKQTGSQQPGAAAGEAPLGQAAWVQSSPLQPLELLSPGSSFSHVTHGKHTSQWRSMYRAVQRHSHPSHNTALLLPASAYSTFTGPSSLQPLAWFCLCSDKPTSSASSGPFTQMALHSVVPGPLLQHTVREVHVC